MLIVQFQNYAHWTVTVVLNFEEYSLYNVILWHRCIVKHFTNPKYNCITSQYHIRGNTRYIENNLYKFKSQYSKLMKNFKTPQEIKLFFVVCCLHNIKDIYKILELYPSLHKLYLFRLNIYNNLETYFKKDIEYIFNRYGSIKNSIKVKEDMSCGIIHIFIKEEITMETLLILQDICDIFKVINSREVDNILWKEEFHKISKYGSFINGFDKDYFKDILTQQ